MIIPRAKIGFSYGQLMRFIFSLFKKLPQGKQAELIDAFEKKFGFPDWQLLGVTFNQARMAFYFLLKNLNLKPGGEVIFSSLHVADFINIILSSGLKPVVVDLDKETYAVDYQDLENKISNRTVLMCITHLSGFATDMDRISEISRKYNVPFIEDCSQAYLSYYKGERLGKRGIAAIFSLSFLKPVCTMTGGIVLSEDRGLLEKLRRERELLADSSKIPLIKGALKHLIYKTITQKWIFILLVFPLLRLFLRPFDFIASYQRSNKNVVLRKKLPQDYFVKFGWQQAKLGLELLEKVRAREETRREKGYFLYQHLTNPEVKEVKLLEESQALFWTFPVRVSNITHFKGYLLKYGIDTSTYLLSVVAEEPAFVSLNLNKTPVTSDIKKHTLLLPMYPQLTQKEVEYLAKIINQYVSPYK